MTKDDENFDPKLRSFLSRAYNLKAIADYEIGPQAHLEPERAADAIAEGTQFVAYIATLVAAARL